MSATGLRMAVACPKCGAEVEHLNGTTNGSLAVALVRCCGCRAEYEITARIVRFRDDGRGHR